MLTRAATRVGSSVVEECQIELAKALEVGDQVDCDDFLSGDREAEVGRRLAARRPPQRHDSIHERRAGGLGTSREGVGHGCRTPDLPRCAGVDGGLVGPEHDVWVEQRQKCDEVAAARGGQEGVDNLALAGAPRLPRDGYLH